MAGSTVMLSTTFLILVGIMLEDIDEHGRVFSLEITIQY